MRAFLMEEIKTQHFIIYNYIRVNDNRHRLEI